MLLVFKYIRLVWYMIEFIYESIIYIIWGPPGEREEENVTNKVVLITGANTGIGKALAMKMAKRGAVVIMACRDLKKGKEAMEDIQYETKSKKIVLMELDLADLKSIKQFAKDVLKVYPEIHILINNAGVCIDFNQLYTTNDGFELHMGVNHLGHFLLVNLLLSSLKRAVPSRIVVVSSSTALFSRLDLNDLMLKNHSNPTKRVVLPLTTLPYNNSKMATALFSKELGNRLRGTGVNVYSVCPGLVNTEVFRNYSFIGTCIAKFGLKFIGLSPNRAANGILYCALSRKCDHETGKFYRFEKLCPSGNRRLNVETARTLWNISENLVV